MTVTVLREAIKGTRRRLSLIVHENKRKMFLSRYVYKVGFRLLSKKIFVDFPCLDGDCQSSSSRSEHPPYLLFRITSIGT